jgi:hypothetical protein
VSLRPDDVFALGFFTRDPRPLVPHLPRLADKGFHVYLHMTVNGYPRELEPRTPSMPEAVAAFSSVASLLGPESTIWRYDPIVLSPELDEAWHLRRFSELASVLESGTRQCYVSFVDPYKKTLRNLPVESDYEVGERHVALTVRLRNVAARHGIELRGCAEPALEQAGIRPGACVDVGLLARLRPDLPLLLEPSPTREDCGCSKSTDIGAYDTCGHGCAYCYATSSMEAGLTSLCRHDPSDTILIRPPALVGEDLDDLVRTDDGRGANTLPLF